MSFSRGLETTHGRAGNPVPRGRPRRRALVAGRSQGSEFTGRAAGGTRRRGRLGHAAIRLTVGRSACA